MYFRIYLNYNLNYLLIGMRSVNNELCYYNSAFGCGSGIPDSNCKILFTVQERITGRLSNITELHDMIE